MKTKTIAVLFFLGLCISAVGQDRCNEWQSWKDTGPESRIFIKICEYASGGSGYYKFKNENNKAVRISFELIFNDDTKFKGSCNIKANSEHSPGACFKCAKKNGGVKQWKLTKIAFEGEEGYR